MRNLTKIALALFLTAAVVRAEPSLIDGIVVIVNSAIITAKDLQDYTRPSEEILEQQFRDRPRILDQKLIDLRRDALDQLVERQLILHDFSSAGYSLPESIIEEEINNRIRKQYGDRLTLTRTLQAQGLTFESYRIQIREQIIVEALTQKNISSEILISPHKIERYYADNKGQYKVEDQVKLRMIVINQPTGAEPGMAKRLAQEILTKLNEGASFSEMASIYSDSSSTRKNGGDWGWTEKGKLRSELDTVAFSLKKGERSGVIETREKETTTACYLMLVEDKKTAGLKALPEIREEIEKALQSQERARLRKKYTDRLKKKSYLRYL